MNIISRTTDLFRPTSSIPLTLPEATKALEQAWQRRRQELGGWQPSNGWLLDQSVTGKRLTSVR